MRRSLARSTANACPNDSSPLSMATFREWIGIHSVLTDRLREAGKRFGRNDQRWMEAYRERAMVFEAVCALPCENRTEAAEMLQAIQSYPVTDPTGAVRKLMEMVQMLLGDDAPAAVSEVY